MGIDHRITTVLIAALCVGCTTVGPDYHRPDAPVPADWAAAAAPGPADAASHVSSRAFDGRRWWAVFRDPVLDQLVDEAMRQNLEVHIAVLRIAEARANRDIAAGAELPSVGANGLGGRTRMSENGIASSLGGGGSSSAGTGTASGSGSSSGGGPALTTNLFQVGFDAVWELDLWGKTRRNVEAADATTESAEQARGEATVSLTAEVARDYLGLRGLQRQRAIVVRDIADQQRLLALVESSARSGLAPGSDVARQATQLQGVRAQLPTIEQNIEQSTNRLALLLALSPGALRERLATPGAETLLPPEVPIGLPGELLRRRPDVMRSEAELHAATARVGVAQAQLFPSIELGATAGLQASHLSDLTDWASRFFIAGAQISMPLFQGGKLKAQTRVADARMQQAVLAYREAVLAAYHDANNALVAYAQEQRRTETLVLQMQQARRARDLAMSRYRIGLSSFSEALETEHDTHQVELAALQSGVTASTNLVALYKALGGDWAAAE